MLIPMDDLPKNTIGVVMHRQVGMGLKGTVMQFEVY